MSKGLVDSDPVIGVVVEHLFYQIHADRVYIFEFFIETPSLVFLLFIMVHGISCDVVLPFHLLFGSKQAQEITIGCSKRDKHLFQLIIGAFSLHEWVSNGHLRQNAANRPHVASAAILLL